ncbi:MAG: hypothetical protein IJ253_07790, partial [Bacteroidaceae bacterium]|nr:hypothetical protein [Bacteroidaceae bacterium]
PIYHLNLGYEGPIADFGNNAGGSHANSPSAGPITVMRNCYSTGKINGTAYNGQLSGWVGWDAIVENCWSTAEVTGVESDEFYMYRRGKATQTNCYSKYGTQATLITDEQVASGELCFKLNGDQSAINWYQTIGEDTHPVLDPKHSVVIKNEDGGYGNLTGIDPPTPFRRSLTSSSGVYDLSGRRVILSNTKNLPKGLYIIDGEKVVVR